jgi:poly-beta-1,6-N-acetyl-D-glucosamine synthase
MQHYLSLAIRTLEALFHLHLLTSLLAYLGVAAISRKHLLNGQYRAVSHERVPFEQFAAPCVSFLIPSFNEGRRIVDSINAALSSDYPKHRVVLINDGSTDLTMPLLIRHYKLQEIVFQQTNQLSKTRIHKVFVSNCDSRLTVIDKPHTGKADTLNVGLGYVKDPYVCCMDGDSIVTPDSLRTLMAKFIDQPDLVALGGAVSPSNEIIVKDGAVIRRKSRRSLLVRVQVIEYLRSMTTWRTGWSYLNGLLIISGALTAFKREALLRIGGYSPETCTEDLDLVLSLHQYHLERNLPYHLWTLPDVICWTRAPKTREELRHQRMRWMYGTLQCLRKHKGLAYNTKNRLIGWVSFPHLVFIEAFAPIIEMTGLICIGAAAFSGLLSIEAILIYGLLVYGVLGLMSWYAIAINDKFIESFSSLRQLLSLGLVSFIEPAGFRQRDAFWRLTAWFAWIRGKPLVWR